jgi:hypothetical protein
MNKTYVDQEVYVPRGWFLHLLLRSGQDLTPTSRCRTLCTIKECEPEYPSSFLGGNIHVYKVQSEFITKLLGIVSSGLFLPKCFGIMLEIPYTCA